MLDLDAKAKIFYFDDGVLGDDVFFLLNHFTNGINKRLGKANRTNNETKKSGYRSFHG